MSRSTKETVKPKSRVSFELSSKTHLSLRYSSSGKIRIDQTKRLEKPTGHVSLKEVQPRKPVREIIRKTKFDEDNISLTSKSVSHDGRVLPVISLITPHLSMINTCIHSRLSEMNGRKSLVGSFVMDSPTETSSSSMISSRLEFNLKRKQFCKGEYTNAKYGRCDRIHPQMGGIPANRLVCSPRSMENSMGEITYPLNSK
ncbi:uncharacterized protein LOC105665109 [Ceratitis capitata]|uniref:uncharacterized protein LOC105665109 n=1 Tax=Ceratitis capitata TaxID=7213 RepID=UPI000618857E|nr:uncharacterized protein LOC105665109 [Ceratitis capitata]